MFVGSDTYPDNSAGGGRDYRVDIPSIESITALDASDITISALNIAGNTFSADLTLASDEQLTVSSGTHISELSEAWIAGAGISSSSVVFDADVDFLDFFGDPNVFNAVTIELNGNTSIDYGFDVSDFTGTGRVDNSGTFSIVGDVGLTIADPLTFNNTGTINTGGSGTGLTIQSTNFANSGTIHVQAGGLDLEAQIDNTGGTIQGVDGATITLSGGLTTLTNDGTLSPAGATIGTMNLTGNLDQNGTLAIDIDGDAADMLNVSGDLALGGTLSLTMLSGGSFAIDEQFAIVDYDGTLDSVGGFTNTLNYDGLTATTDLFAVGLAVFEIDYTTGNQVTLIFKIPEPSGILLLAVAALAAGGISYRRMKKRRITAAEVQA